MEATFHGIVAAVGIVLGVVALALFCKMKKWWNDCAGSDSHIQESTRRHWSRVRAGLRRRRVGGDLEGGYQRNIGIPLPKCQTSQTWLARRYPPCITHAEYKEMTVG